MKSKKIMIVFVSIFILAVSAMLIYSAATKNIIKTYQAEVIVNDDGSIDVKEILVMKYRRYENYYLWDIKYNKTDYSQNPYNFSSSDYKNDNATLDTNSVNVEVYRGDYLDDYNSCTDITGSVDIGYSYKGDKYKTESGTYPVECYQDSDDCESIAIDAIDSGTLIGDMTFIYTYTITGVVTEFNDCAELNFKMFSYQDRKVKKAYVTFILPHTSLAEEDFYCYGHGLSNGNIVQTDNYRFDYSAKNIGENDEFECRLIFPLNVCDSINDNNKINKSMESLILNYEESLMKDTYIQYIIAIVINVITGIIGVIMIFVFVHVYKKYDKEFIPEFDKQYLRELPYDYTPAEMSYLYYFGKTNDEDVTATLLDLIRRGFIEMENRGQVNDDNPDIVFRLVNDKINSSGSELLPHETHLIKWFFKDIGSGEEVTIEQIESYGKSYSQAQKFESDGKEFSVRVKLTGEKHDFFINTMNDKKSATSFGIIPVIGIGIILVLGVLNNITTTLNIILLILVAIVYMIYVGTIKKRSKNGVEEFAKWTAFKNFLEDFSSFKDYPIPGLIVWEHFLVYATSLKIADKVMTQLKVKLPQIPDDEGTFMSSRYYYGRSNTYIFVTMNRVNRSMSMARTNMISTIAAHNASNFKGGGHGGGFSGGSSFGGGGGGGRGGR